MADQPGSMQRDAVDGERLAGLDVPCEIQACRGGFAFAVDGSGEGRQDRHPFAGPLVHARFAARFHLLVLNIGSFDRTWDRPRSPACGLVESPLREIEVEGSHRHQHVGSAVTLHCGLDDLTRLIA